MSALANIRLQLVPEGIGNELPPGMAALPAASSATPSWVGAASANMKALHQIIAAKLGRQACPVEDRSLQIHNAELQVLLDDCVPITEIPNIDNRGSVIDFSKALTCKTRRLLRKDIDQAILILQIWAQDPLRRYIDNQPRCLREQAGQVMESFTERCLRGLSLRRSRGKTKVVECEENAPPGSTLEDWLRPAAPQWRRYYDQFTPKEPLDSVVVRLIQLAALAIPRHSLSLPVQDHSRSDPKALSIIVDKNDPVFFLKQHISMQIKRPVWQLSLDVVQKNALLERLTQGNAQVSAMTHLPTLLQGKAVIAVTASRQPSNPDRLEHHLLASLLTSMRELLHLHGWPRFLPQAVPPRKS